MNERYGAVIPSFNAGAHLGPVLEKVKRYMPARNIVVVDDGSSDDTGEVARRSGVSVVAHAENRGKGEALKTGFEYMSRREDGIEIEAAFTLDADGQHDPDEIPAFIEAYENGAGGIIVGNRMGHTEGMPWIRRMTNRFTSALVSFRAGTRIEDSQSGYRLIRTDIMRSLQIVTKRYDTESEILIKAAHGGTRIGSVPIRTIYADEQSTINPLRDTIRFFMLFFRSFFW